MAEPTAPHPPGPGNADVARALERLAGLLEIRGENAFKIRAYRTAAQQIENLAEPLADIAAAGGLRDLPGFGEAIATKVETLLTTGRLPQLERIEAEIPPSLLEVRAVQGIGPRMAYTLYREIGVSTVEELAQAVEAGRLTGLPRMGPRTVENITTALAGRLTTGGDAPRRPRGELAPLAERLLAEVRAVPGVDSATVAGSFRRELPTCRDLDILAATRAPAAVLAAVAALPAVERVLLRGTTKCSVLAGGGVQVDVRAVAPEEIGAALQYFTGSRAHNVRLRGRARDRGLTVNEYGVYRLDGGGRVAGATEEDVYAAVGLRWIPPADREDRGEFTAFALPDSPALIPVEV